MWRNFHLNFEVQVLISGFNPKHGGWFSCSNLSLEEAFHCLGKGCLVPRVSVYYQSQSSHLELLERDFTPWLQNWPRNGSKRSEQLKSNLTDMNKSPPCPQRSRTQLCFLGPTLGTVFLCWLVQEIPNMQPGRLQLHRLHHSSSSIAKDQSELSVAELCFDTLQTLINYVWEQEGWMVTPWPATPSRLIPPAVFRRGRKAPWCMSAGKRQWKSCLNISNCHWNTKQAKWMLVVQYLTLPCIHLARRFTHYIFISILTCTVLTVIMLGTKYYSQNQGFTKQMHFICGSLLPLPLLPLPPPCSARSKITGMSSTEVKYCQSRCCSAAMQNYPLACLMDYLLSLNIDYRLLMLTGTYGLSNSVPMLCNGGVNRSASWIPWRGCATVRWQNQSLHCKVG